MKESTSYLVQHLLIKNKIHFDKKELKLQIESHPTYPSLHAITGVLDHFGIEYLALDIPQNEEVYKELSNYFIAHIKLKEKREFVFVRKKKQSLILTYSNIKKKKISKNIFLNQWSGVMLAIEKHTLENNSKPLLTQLKFIPYALLGLSIAFLIFQLDYITYITSIQIVLSSIGLFIATLLIKHELGLNSEVIERLCSQSKKTSCDAVLNSKGATIFGLFKLNDVSFVYFSSITILWLVNLYTNNINSVLRLITIISTPVVIYSIYYQALIVKKWCPMCLATAGIIIIQVILIIMGPLSFQFNYSEFIISIGIVSIINLLYYQYKNLFSKNLKLNTTKLEYFKFKRNFLVFEILHKQNPIIDTLLPKVTEITFGNPNAKNEIILITNPLCNFCKVVHKDVDKLLKMHQMDVMVIIRFNVNINDKKNTSYQIATTLINLYQKDKLACKEALFHIYMDNVDVHKWLKRYALYLEPTQHFILKSENNWCIENNIHFTPAIYVNKREYPNSYELSDLTLFIEEFKNRNT